MYSISALDERQALKQTKVESVDCVEASYRRERSGPPLRDGLD